MPPRIAAILTLAGIVFLLVRDARLGEARSSALWIPMLWICITGSRFVGQWMSLGSFQGHDDSEGSTIDALVFASLIALGLVVLLRRGVRTGDVLRSNGWIFAMLAYGLASVLWADESMLALKRWIKALGHPVLALVILTEDDPKAALRTVFKRFAIVVLPLSVLFIKYFPEYGRGFDAYTGGPTNHGVSLTKTDLGYLCMASGTVLTWNLLTLARIDDRRERRIEAVLTLSLLAMAGWLLHSSESKTSLVALIVAVAVMFCLGSRMVSKRHFGLLFVVVVTIAFLLEVQFDLYEQTLALLGRDPTLTDRTAVWADALQLQQRPWFGYGFENFWLGDRLAAMWQKWWWRPNQAHSGYIETYLNLGYVGLGLLMLVMLSTFRRITQQFQTDFDFARLRMAFLFAIALFNYTEATFKGVHILWTVFFVIAMEAPRRAPEVQRSKLAKA